LIGLMNLHAEPRTVNLPAKPEDITIDPARTAVLVVDMQNAFASKGGMFDLIGLDISGAKSAVAATKKVIEAARAAKLKVIYLLLSYAPDLSDSGGVDSPHWHKESGLILMRKNPELKGKILTRGTWDEAVVDALKPTPTDIIIRKSRYSGFVGTNLDVVLKTYNIKYLVFTGIATNVCVESTLRDAFFREYWPIIVSDAVNNAGPPATQQGTLWNVETVFGWVTNSEDFVMTVSIK
jgi:ureidoacrylate peracid hydrolase